MKEKVYLGDGVYAWYNGYAIVLTAENGIENTDAIYLEPSTLESLKAYIESLR